jgi:hypothetical protein
LIDPSLKENETMEVLKREGSILKYRVTSLWLTYIGEKGLWDKSEVLLGTLWGTCQEPGNSLL